MRALDDPAFIDFLMKIGDGDEPTNDVGERAILSPKNEFVDDINSMLIQHMPGEALVYISDDLANNVNNQGYYIDYLNTLEPKGLPQHRRQIPIRLCFAMTINKAQGQTLDFVGIYLKQPVFSHGQLYVALSRARKGANGNEMLAIAFSTAIAPISNTLKPFQVFKITNAEIQEASNEYMVIRKNDLQFDSMREIELPNLLTDYSIAFAKDLVDRMIVPVHQVQNIVSTEECKDYWTRAYMQISLDDQELYYIGCNVFDDTGRVTAGAIGLVAEQILQTTAGSLSQVLRLGVKYDLDPKPGGSRRLLLVAYVNDIDPSDAESLGIGPHTLPGNASITGESSVSLSSDVTNLSSTFEKSGHNFPISPLKRQMDNVTICPGDGASPTKKQLTFDDKNDNACAKMPSALLPNSSEASSS
ncbi:hypothetical protein LIER_33146 [Lithospermum erythrorhizon]|uniref:DNA helicase n=1 Tax=Lithospermum erythrorhizon TaxID=34254 RepID=A0AAV3RXK5_LITER